MCATGPPNDVSPSRRKASRTSRQLPTTSPFPAGPENSRVLIASILAHVDRTKRSCQKRPAPGREELKAMDFELPEELRLLKENVRRFVDRELIPLERDVVNDIKLQKELPQKLRPKSAALR